MADRLIQIKLIHHAAYMKTKLIFRVEKINLGQIERNIIYGNNCTLLKEFPVHTVEWKHGCEVWPPFWVWTIVRIV